jgi:hypothetical protein
VIFTPLKRSRCVEKCREVRRYAHKFLTPKSVVLCLKMDLEGSKPQISKLRPTTKMGPASQIPKVSFKRGLIDKSMGFFVIRVLNVDYISILGLQMLLIVTPQKLNQSLVDYFYLRIYMWMECCISLQLGVHLLPKCSPKGTKKSSVPFLCYVPSYPKVHLDLFKEHV